ncbi:MAG TPA: TRAP transporter substrate-binding protein DctP [Polyangia bacterium]|nr:TRAP transporter substrate-binding protein DctP [Polyangia bacterium]
MSVIIGASAAARGEPTVVLRFASEAPQGTAWAREGQALERDIAELTHGQVRIKWYLNGIAGDETQMLDRMRRDQLDGVASGGMMCQKLAPSMRVMRIPGLFQSRDESQYVSGRLKEDFDREMLRNGFVNLGELGIGPDVLFSRKPISDFTQLRATATWIWDLDDVYKAALSTMGINVVPSSLQGAYRTFEDGKIDAFLAVPTAALAYQWSAETHYYSDLRTSFLRGCLIVTSRAFDQLSIEGQHAVKQATARGIVRLEEVGREQDDALLGGLFAKQGLKPVPVSESFRSEFYAAARAMREQLGERLVPAPLLQRVLGLLADYRAERHAP